MWANFYTCTATRGIVLDFIPSTDWESFAESFRRFISHRRCPTHVISDCGRNIISFHTQSFVNNLGITWHTSLPLFPWYVGFFERLMKVLKSCYARN